MTQGNRKSNWIEVGEKKGIDSKTDHLFFENQVWLDSEDAARYLRRSVGQIRNMVYRRQLRYRKFCRRLYFRRLELDKAIESFHQKGF